MKSSQSKISKPLCNSRLASAGIGSRDIALDSVDVVNHRTIVGRNRTAAMRTRIVIAAAQVFSAKGVDAPVIDDFVRAAGISRGTFYNHFATTVELLEATVGWLRDDMNRSIVRAVSGIADPVRQTATAMRLYLRWATASPTLSAFVGRLPEIGADAMAQARKDMIHGILLGEFVVPDADVGCDLAFGTMAESIRRAASLPAGALSCDDVVTAILRGLGVRPQKLREVMALPLPSLAASATEEVSSRPLAKHVS